MDIHEKSWISMTLLVITIREILSVRARRAHEHAQRSARNELVLPAQGVAAAQCDGRS